VSLVLKGASTALWDLEMQSSGTASGNEDGACYRVVHVEKDTARYTGVARCSTATRNAWWFM
jgi:hypothetical protein